MSFVSKTPSPCSLRQLFFMCQSTIAKECRATLAQHGDADGLCAPHVCGDICERVGENIREALAAAREQHKLEFEKALGSNDKCTRQELLQTHSDLFIADACRILKDAEFRRTDKGRGIDLCKL